MSELSPLYEHIEALPTKKQYILRILSLLSWFDVQLFEHVVPFEKNHTAFEEIVRSNAVKQLSRIDHNERFTVVPLLKANLCEELRVMEPHTFRSINLRAANYFHRSIDELKVAHINDVVLELRHLSLAEPQEADELLARFASFALGRGWFESAYRAASAVYEHKSTASRFASTARLITTLVDTLLADSEEERSQFTAKLLSSTRDIGERLSKGDPRRSLLVYAEDVLHAPTTVWAIESRNSAVLAAQDELHRSGYALVRDRIFDSQAIEMRRDSIDLESAERIRREAEVLFSLSAWTEWGGLSRQQHSVIGIGVGFFRPNDDAIIDSLRLTDGSGRAVEHLRAVESKALALAALERSEHYGSDPATEQPYLPLVAITDGSGVVPRSLQLQYEEPSTRRPRVRFGSMDFVHQIDAVQARTHYVDIATPDGLVAHGVGLALEPRNSEGLRGISKDVRFERRILTSSLVTGHDREIHRFVLHVEPMRDLLPFATLTLHGRFSLPRQFFGWSSLVVLLSAALSFLGLYVSFRGSDTSSLRYFLISVVLPFGALLDVVLRASSRERRAFGQREVYRVVAARVERFIGAALLLFTGAVIAPTAGASNNLSAGLFTISGVTSVLIGAALGARWLEARTRDGRLDDVKDRRVRSWN